MSRTFPFRLARTQVRNLAGRGALLVMLWLVAGCGGSDGGQTVVSPEQNSSVYVGHFLGTSTVSDGQTALLDLTTSSAGTASANLLVAIPVPVPLQAQDDAMAATGTVNLSNGSFSLSGSAAGVGPFSVTGSLPAGNGLGSFQLLLDGQTYPGTIQRADLGTPSPPGGGGGGGGGTISAEVINEGQLSSLVFTPGAGYNGASPPLTSSASVSGSITRTSAGVNGISFSLSQTTPSGGAQERTETLGVGMAVASGETLVVGRSYPVATSAPGAYVNLTETTGPIGGPDPIPLQAAAPISLDRSWSQTAASTGSLTVTSLTASSIEVDFAFVNVGPTPDLPRNSALGSFSVSGHVRGTFTAAGR